MACALALHMALRAWPQQKRHNKDQNLGVTRALCALESCLLAALTGAVGFARVYLGYHDLGQVAAGAAVGILFGLCWAALTNPVCVWLQARNRKATNKLT